MVGQSGQILVNQCNPSIGRLVIHIIWRESYETVLVIVVCFLWDNNLSLWPCIMQLNRIYGRSYLVLFAHQMNMAGEYGV